MDTEAENVRIVALLALDGMTIEMNSNVLALDQMKYQMGNIVRFVVAKELFAFHTLKLCWLFTVLAYHVGRKK